MLVVLEALALWFGSGVAAVAYGHMVWGIPSRDGGRTKTLTLTVLGGPIALASLALASIQDIGDWRAFESRERR